MVSQLKDGNRILIETLRRWGITCYTGINGGTISHLTQHLEPFTSLAQLNHDDPTLFSLSEYAAGFVPIGYFLGSGQIAACIVCAGAATKLAASGMSDCKLQNIPAVYLVALNSSLTNHLAPLQDVSADGINIIPQLKAEFGAGCIVISDIDHLERQLRQAQKILAQSQPVILLFHPNILSKTTRLDRTFPAKKLKAYTKADLVYFLEQFPSMSKGRRIIIYVCSEAARGHDVKPLTTALSCMLHAPTVWSVNGANAVDVDNPYGYGYITFGGNDKALALWKSINSHDILITLGFDAGEYALNLKEIPAGDVWHFTNFPQAYGHLKGRVKHRVTGNYHQVKGDITTVISDVIKQLSSKLTRGRPTTALSTLNTRVLTYQVKPDCVDFAAFYEAIQCLWQPNSIGFDDICVAYKDRQYITQRPHPFITFYTLDQGSAMGGAYGLGIGAKLSNPSQHVFIFAGDGCWRLFGGSLAEAAKLDLRLFIINNKKLAIVDKGLEDILPTIDRKYYHGSLAKIDFIQAATAHGWYGIKLKPDLSNLKAIMTLCYTKTGQSILIDVPVDPDQILGVNRRLKNLKFSP